MFFFNSLIIHRIINILIKDTYIQINMDFFITENLLWYLGLEINLTRLFHGLSDVEFFQRRNSIRQCQADGAQYHEWRLELVSIVGVEPIEHIDANGLDEGLFLPLALIVLQINCGAHLGAVQHILPQLFVQTYHIAKAQVYTLTWNTIKNINNIWLTKYNRSQFIHLPMGGLDEQRLLIWLEMISLTVWNSSYRHNVYPIKAILFLA